jgi:hypothetical protein
VARPDISLLYYPSIYDFLWMAARTARYLNAKGNATVRIVSACVRACVRERMDEELTQLAGVS